MQAQDMMKYGYIELRMVIQWAKRVPGFKSISMTDQMNLLKSCFMDLNVLRLAYRWAMCNNETQNCHGYHQGYEVLWTAPLSFPPFEWSLPPPPHPEIVRFLKEPYSSKICKLCIESSANVSSGSHDCCSDWWKQRQTNYWFHSNYGNTSTCEGLMDELRSNKMLWSTFLNFNLPSNVWVLLHYFTVMSNDLKGK